MQFLDALLDQLKALYGEPTHLDGQTAYQWQVRSGNGSTPVYLCLTIEPATHRASAWIFDATKDGNNTYHLSVTKQSDVDEALESVQRHMPMVQRGK